MRIQTYLSQENLTQTALAERACVAQSTLAKIVSKQRNCGPHLALVLWMVSGGKIRPRDLAMVSADRKRAELLIGRLREMMAREQAEDFLT